MVRATHKDSTWTAPKGPVPGTSHWLEALGKTPDMLDYISQLAWDRLGILPKKLLYVSLEKEVWSDLLGMLSPWPSLGNEKSHI